MLFSKNMKNEITVEDAAKKIAEGGVQVLDVRTPDERARGYIEGSENLNFYDQDFMSKIEKLDRSKTYIVYCASGGRSGKTVKMMHGFGFNACCNLMGGFNEWVKKGMKVGR
jgi:phage shock protein E